MFRRSDPALPAFVAQASIGHPYRALLAAALVMCSGVSVACSDFLFGARPGGVAHIALAPHFGVREAAIYSELDRFNLGVQTIRIVLTRPNSTDTLADTTVTIQPGQLEIAVQLHVELQQTQEELTAAMEMYSGTVLVFSGTTTVIAKVGSAAVASAPPILVPLWVGPGKDVTRIRISPRDPAIPANGSITFTATAFDANDAPFDDPDYVARWQWVVIDSNLASFTPNTTTLVGKGTPGVARVMVFTPNLLRDTVHVTLLSGQASSVTFARGIEIVDRDATVAAPATARRQDGQPLTGVTLTYVSRTPAIATVSPTGVITGVAKGQAVIVASVLSDPQVADSILAVVAEPGGPVVVSSVERFRYPRDTTFTVSIFVDMRTSPKRLGSATVDVEWDAAQLQYQNNANGSSGVSPTVNASNTPTGKLVLAMADVTGFIGRVELLRITFKSSASTTVGQLKLTARELNASDYSDLLPLTVQVLHPISVP
jgi:hypothetical protein